MITKEELQQMFRAGELQRRDARRTQILREFKILEARAKNEGMLLFEELSSEAKEAHKLAVERMKEQSLQFEKEITPGYWRRLWRALLDH